MPGIGENDDPVRVMIWQDVKVAELESQLDAANSEIARLETEVAGLKEKITRNNRAFTSYSNAMHNVIKSQQDIIARLRAEIAAHGSG
jgi:hypothetical protein